MTCPDKPTSAEEWLHYIDGTAAARDRDALDRHIDSCANCREISGRLTASRAELTRTARLEQSMPNHGTLSRLWDSVRFRIRRSSEAPRDTPGLDLRQLRSILTSMCGEATADGALHQALPDDVGFAKNLGSIVEVMCGNRAARFVEHAAQSARKDMVA
jgi:anti-sigma factor RsiW